MSIWERLAWGVPFGLLALANAIAWYRDERQIKQIQRAHEAELVRIRQEAEARGICGDAMEAAPVAGGLLICDLPAEHRGWHGAGHAHERTNWHRGGAPGGADD